MWSLVLICTKIQFQNLIHFIRSPTKKSNDFFA